MFMFSILIKIITSQTLRTITKICSTVQCVIKYLSEKFHYQKKKEENEQKMKDFKTIDDVCDNGSIDDLFDLKNKVVKIILISSMFAISGCINFHPEVKTTKPWENHYKTVEEFQNGTKDMQLEKGESIWVLSNSSLSRLLKDLKK
jgi:hypothetical protein